MNDNTKDMREKTIVLLSLIAELVLKKRNLYVLLCVIRAGNLALWYTEMWVDHISKIATTNSPCTCCEEHHPPPLKNLKIRM